MEIGQAMIFKAKEVQQSHMKIPDWMHTFDCLSPNFIGCTNDRASLNPTAG